VAAYSGEIKIYIYIICFAAPLQVLNPQYYH